jgi:hypothetical protein
MTWDELKQHHGGSALLAGRALAEDMVDSYNNTALSGGRSGSAAVVASSASAGSLGDEEMELQQSPGGAALTKDDLIVDVSELHWGAKDRNPVQDVRFFSKDTEKAVANDVVQAHVVPEGKYQGSLPRVFCERIVRVFCRHPESQAAAEKAFKQWTQARDAPSPFLGASQPTPSLSQF